MSTTDATAHHKPFIPAEVRRAAAVAQQAFDAQNQDQAVDPVAAQPPEPDQPAATEAPAAPAATTVVEAPAPQTTDTVDWKHRFDSLKGKHDAEIGRLNAEIDGLHRILASMQAAQPQGPGAGPAAPAPGAADQHFSFDFAPLTEEEKQDYGEEFLSVAERAAAQKFAPIIKQLTDKISKLEQNVGQVTTVVQTDARAEVFRQLNEAVPNWEAQDRDPLFIDWLRYPDPFSGMARQVLLDKAMQENNGPRVVAFFKAFKDLQATSGAPASPAPSPAPAPAAKPRTSLETLAAPGRGRPGTAAGAPAQTGDTPVYTQSRIQRFYEDVRKGVFRNNPAEKARIEAEIVRAATEGRVMSG